MRNASRPKLIGRYPVVEPHAFERHRRRSRERFFHFFLSRADDATADPSTFSINSDSQAQVLRDWPR